MKYQISRQASRVVLSLSDQLTISDGAEFDAMVPKLLDAGSSSISVNLENLEYMDSAGLGYLLTLREHADRQHANVTLSKPFGAVKELLELARFDTLFPFE